MLYQQNAKVYVAARSEAKAQAAMNEIRLEHADSLGQLEYLYLDLANLVAVKSSAQQFLDRESRLDVLWNNAGVMVPPEGSKTAQGYELQLGVNNIASFLFTLLLQPIMAATAKSAPQNSVRVVWVSSHAASLAPRPAIDFENMDYRKAENKWVVYMRSKAGCVLHAAELARRSASNGVLSLVMRMPA